MLKDLTSFVNLPPPRQFTTSKDILDFFSEKKTFEKNTYNIPHFYGHFFNSIRTKNIHFIKYPFATRPKLVSFFISLFSKQNDIVLDPFVGRGTTILEALLQRRYAIGIDCNPLTKLLMQPRLHIPTQSTIEQRLFDIPLKHEVDITQPFGKFFHPHTFAELVAWKGYFLTKESLDPVDSWLQMVIMDRLSGKANTFFRDVDAKRICYKNTRKIIQKKTDSLFKGLYGIDIKIINNYAKKSNLFIKNSSKMPFIEDDSIDLVVTSPPMPKKREFYEDFKYLAWFKDYSREYLLKNMLYLNDLEKWSTIAKDWMTELQRVIKPGKFLVIEYKNFFSEVTNVEKLLLKQSLMNNLDLICFLTNNFENGKESVAILQKTD